MWVAERHTARLLWLCVCVCWSSIAGGVGVDRRRACPHRRDVGPWCTACVNGVATVLGTLVLRGCVCVAIAVVGPTMVTQRVGEGWEDEATIRWCSFVYLGRFGDGPLRLVVRYSMATHPIDP